MLQLERILAVHVLGMTIIHYIYYSHAYAPLKMTVEKNYRSANIEYTRILNVEGPRNHTVLLHQKLVAAHKPYM